MIRAQTAAASLAASLEVLARFVTAALQPELRSAAEQRVEQSILSRVPETQAQPLAHPVTEVASATPPPQSATWTPPAPEPVSAPVISEAVMKSQPAETVEERRASDMMEEGAPIIASAAPSIQEFEAAPVISEAVMESQPAEAGEDRRQPDMMEEGTPAAAAVPPAIPAAEFSDTGLASDSPVHLEPDLAPVGETAAPPPFKEFPPAAEAFDISKLPAGEQELHRRANRVAKVSMQDIRMLRPNDVKSGKEHKDLCHRLRDDIERAHKEYDRRFQSILGHPVDYFYDWMVEILADGDPGALGEYPYPSPVLRH
jgi:hypothetical protein